MPEYRDPKKKIDRARNIANLQEEVTTSWVPEDSGPGIFVVIMDHMEKLSTRLDDAEKQIQDLFSTTKVLFPFLCICSIAATSLPSKATQLRLGLSCKVYDIFTDSHMCSTSP